MSYDLVFWRQTESCADDPASTYRRLQEDQPVDGLVDLPIASFLDAVLARFPGAVREPNGDREWIFCEREDGSAFEVWWSSQHVLACCRRSPNEDLNALIDVALDHGCRLYDPQTNERFA